MAVVSKDPRWKQSRSDGSEVRALWNRVGFTRRASSSWWADADRVEIGNHLITDPEAWIGLAMFKRALSGEGPAVHVANFEGNLIVPADKLIETLTSTISVRPVRYAHGDNQVNVMLSGEHTMLQFYTTSGGKCGVIRASSVDEKAIEKLAKLAKGVLAMDNPEEGFIFGLAKSQMGGYYLSRVGAAGQALERGNYVDEVLTKYDHVVADLNAQTPCGRLSIFSGVPGSGKTFLVRALLKEAPRAAFVLVPSYLVKELGSPEILPTLANVKNDGFKGPIALLLEDADQALVNRTAGDIAAISSLLNLGDGILGNILDIRIITTTNAAKLEMDPATRRPGRLCSHIEVNQLPIPKAAAVMERLTGKVLHPKRPMTIAECYKAARQFGWAPPKVEPKDVIRKEIL